MGMCAIRGPRVLDAVEGLDEAELSSPRSCTTMSTSYTRFGSATSQDLDDIAEAVSQFYEDDDGAIWQRTIPRGRRCKPLSFAGAIVYDEYGNLLTPPQEDDQETDEYFSPLKNLAEVEESRRGGRRLSELMETVNSNPYCS